MSGITQVLNRARETDEQFPDETQHIPLQVVALPVIIQKTHDTIGTVFAATAKNLRGRAAALRGAAADLEARADQLDSAGPSVQKTLVDWVEFERECNAASARLAAV